MLHCGNGKNTCENKLRSYKYKDYTMTKERLFYKEKFHYEKVFNAYAFKLILKTRALPFSTCSYI